MSEPSAIPDHAHIRPGDRIAGKYRVERVLGTGGMGTVLAVTHLDLQEIRAIKLMHPMHLENAHAIERFLREARVISRLKNDHIPRLYDVGRLESGAPYMVMEVLEGKDLRHLIKERGPLPVHEAVQYLLQTCEAVAEAHASGIVHRDLKPANLFLTFRADGTPCIKVLDFGISKLLEPTPDGGDMTKTLDVLGSLHYMAPEQLRSSRYVDPRADIWSLGVILYRMLTGRLPFQGDTPLGYIMALRGTAHPPRAFRSSMPKELDAVVMRCLEKDPERRTPNIKTLMMELQPFAEAQSQDAPLINTTDLPIYRTVLPSNPPSAPEAQPESQPSESVSLTQPMSTTLPGAHLLQGATAPLPSSPEAIEDTDSLPLSAEGLLMEAEPSLPSTLTDASKSGEIVTADATSDWGAPGRSALDSTEPLPPSTASNPSNLPSGESSAVPEYYDGPSPLETMSIALPSKTAKSGPASAESPPSPATKRSQKKGIPITLFVAVGCMAGILIGLSIAIATVYFRPPSTVMAPPPKVDMVQSTAQVQGTAPTTAPSPSSSTTADDETVEFLPPEPSAPAGTGTAAIPALSASPAVKKPLKPLAPAGEPSRKRPFD